MLEYSGVFVWFFGLLAFPESSLLIWSHDLTHMLEDQLIAFFATVEVDTSLQVMLGHASSPDDVVCIAKDAGFDISAEALVKINKLIEDESDEEISIDDLASASGGWFWGSQAKMNFISNRIYLLNKFFSDTAFMN